MPSHLEDLLPSGVILRPGKMAEAKSDKH